MYMYIVAGPKCLCDPRWPLWGHGVSQAFLDCSIYLRVVLSVHICSSSLDSRVTFLCKFLISGLVACFGIVGYGFYCSKVPALNHRVNKMFKLSTGAQFFTASVLMWSLYRNELSRQAKQTETNNEGWTHSAWSVMRLQMCICMICSNGNLLQLSKCGTEIFGGLNWFVELNLPPNFLAFSLWCGYTIVLYMFSEFTNVKLP